MGALLNEHYLSIKTGKIPDMPFTPQPTSCNSAVFPLSYGVELTNFIVYKNGIFSRTDLHG
jgi:hypothetical protein